MANQVYFVTGANRGIGLGLVKALLARPSTTVIASVRNDDGVAGLESETKSISGTGSTLHIVKLDFSTAIAPEEVREAVLAAATPAIDHVDVLICNAGYAGPMTPAATTTASELRTTFEINTIAPLLVFQGVYPLLLKATTAPKLIMVSSSVGSIGAQEPMSGGAYGPSRAAGNWLTRSIHLQHDQDGLVAVALHPGWVQTRAGHFVASQWGVADGPPETIERSVAGMLAVIDAATRESVGGKFISYDGAELQW